MKHFHNHPHQLVQESIDGLIASSGGRLTRLDGFPDIKVVVRTDIDPSKVALISGGGSGHEPAHAGFVGEGMLTAAVCGEVFASPSVEAVLAAILAVTGEAGCLLIVKNYTGDRLNFGLAAEQARARGKRVEIVTVADDIALPEVDQPRGIAGTLFVHKLAGAVAAAGGTLENVAALARKVANGTLSIGMSLNTCHPPGSGDIERLGPDEAELGLGIHGEPGAEKIPAGSADELVARMLAKLPAEFSHAGPPANLALLVNNLGAVPPLEMTLLTQSLLKSPLGSQVKLLVGPGPLMTSYDMNGFSISLLPLDAELEQALRAPTEVGAWPPVQAPFSAAPLPLPVGLKPPSFPASSDAKIRATLLRICTTLIASESDLNALDAQIGDGDTGSTLAHAARSVEEAIDTLPLADPAELLQPLGQILARVMGGSSGVLLSIMLSAASLATGQGYLPALRQGLKRMSEIGGAHPGDRTAVDALEPALAQEIPTEAARAARTGADATATMRKAKAGRSVYVPADSLHGVVDPGAEAVARVFAALA